MEEIERARKNLIIIAYIKQYSQLKALDWSVDNDATVVTVNNELSKGLSFRKGKLNEMENYFWFEYGYYAEDLKE